jgi:hypothetical protein
VCTGLSEFERFAGQRGLLNGAAALTSLAANSEMDSSDSGDCRDKATESSDPPREPREVDRHLEGKKGSHAEEAGTEQANLRECGGVELIVRILARPGQIVNNALRVELNPASSQGYGGAKGNKYPIQKGHDV